MTVPLLSSCSGLLHYVTDPQAKTPGYRLFTGHTEGLRISFEYPDTWKRLSIEKYDAFELLRIDDENSASINVVSDVNAANGGEFENAHTLLQHYLSHESDSPTLKILSQGKVLLGNVEGEEVSYSSRFTAEHMPGKPADYIVDKVVIWRYIVVDYKGRIYDIHLLVDADKYDAVKEGFEHLIATFRFLE